MSTVPYRDFYYPLNVFMHIIEHEEGDVLYLHYGLFTSPGEALVAAQKHANDLLLQRLPSPPARVLDVGSGIGTTLDQLARRGYDVVGITPDEKQIAYIHRRYGQHLPLIATSFEQFESRQRFDVLLFQESSQYVDSSSLFSRARGLSERVLVLDEFALSSAKALHSWSDFIAAAERNGFRIAEELDVSANAAPTIDYFLERLPRHRQRLMQDLALSSEQIDALIESGNRYREAYARGDYVYRLIDFTAPK